MCPYAKIILCTRNYNDTSKSIARVYGMSLDAAEVYALQMNGEIQDIINEKGHCLLLELEKSIHQNAETIQAIIDYCELEGVLQSDIDRAMYYLTFYKDYKTWPSKFAPKE
jgi:hypothetical protein